MEPSNCRPTPRPDQRHRLRPPLIPSETAPASRNLWRISSGSLATVCPAKKPNTYPNAIGPLSAQPCRLRAPPRTSGIHRGCAKTPAFNLRVEGSSRFGQSENQKFWRRLSEEGNRENDSTHSWLAHVFTSVDASVSARGILGTVLRVVGC
jgi:hypothetical protein